MAQKDSLVTLLKLDEASGTLVDAHGSNDFTDNNTVGAAGGKVESGSRQFTAANSEYGEKTSFPLTDTGEKLLVTAWVYLDSLTEFMTVTGGSWQLDYRSGKARMVWQGTIVSATSFGNLSTGTWYYVEAGYDGSNVFCGVNRTVNSSATGGSPPGGTVTQRVGSLSSSLPRYWNGRIEQLAIHIGATLPSSSDRDARYNSGSGLAFASWDAGGGGPTIPRGLSSIASPYGSSVGQVALEGI